VERLGAVDRLAQPALEEPLREGREREAGQVIVVAEAAAHDRLVAAEGALRDHGANALVVGAHQNGDHRPHGHAQDPDASGVDFRPGAEHVQGAQQVSLLPQPHGDGVAAALAAMAVVEGEDGVPGAVEEIGVGKEFRPAAGPSVGEDDGGDGRGGVPGGDVPPGQPGAVATGEVDLLGRQIEVRQAVVLHPPPRVKEVLRDEPGDRGRHGGEGGGGHEQTAQHHNAVEYRSTGAYATLRRHSATRS
jgi:hypothetical protein